MAMNMSPFTFDISLISCVFPNSFFLFLSPQFFVVYSYCVGLVHGIYFS